MGYTDQKQLNELAIHRLRELSVRLDSDPEMIEEMPSELVKSELAEIGLDPNKSVSMFISPAVESAPSVEPSVLESTSNDFQAVPGSTSRGSFQAATNCERNKLDLDYALASDSSEMGQRLERSAVGSERLINEKSRRNDEASELRLEQLRLRIQQVQSRYAQYLREYESVTNKSQLVTAEFAYLALLHNREFPSLGNEFFARHEGDTEKARYYFVSAILSTTVAVVLGIYFVVTALIPTSKFLVILASTMSAASLVFMSGAIIRLLTGANPENPDSIPKLKRAVVWFGGLFFALLAIFMSLRFGNVQRLGLLLPIIMAGLEFSAIALAGGFECLSRIYRWSSDLDKQNRHLLQRKTELALRLKQEVATLEDLQTRKDPGKIPSYNEFIDFDFQPEKGDVQKAAVGYP